MDLKNRNLIILLIALFAALFGSISYYALLLNIRTQGNENIIIAEDAGVTQTVSSSLQDLESSIESDLLKEDFGTGISVIESLNIDMPAVPERFELREEKYSSAVRRYIYSLGTNEVPVTVLFHNDGADLGIRLTGKLADASVFKTLRGLALGDVFAKVYEKYGEPDFRLKEATGRERVSYVYKDEAQGLDWWLSFNGSGGKVVAMWLRVKVHASENSSS